MATQLDYTLDFAHINFRERPQLYAIGRGEQGVLLVQPYKSEILPYWRFKTPEVALASAKKIYSLFLAYLKKEDFIGADMARKFLQMGYTRSRRYANHASGHKYDGPVPVDKRGQSGAHGREVLPNDPDLEKAESAKQFYPYWQKAADNAKYKIMMAQFKEKYK